MEGKSNFFDAYDKFKKLNEEKLRQHKKMLQERHKQTWHYKVHQMCKEIMRDVAQIKADLQYVDKHLPLIKYDDSADYIMLKDKESVTNLINSFNNLKKIVNTPIFKDLNLQIDLQPILDQASSISDDFKENLKLVKEISKCQDKLEKLWQGFSAGSGKIEYLEYSDPESPPIDASITSMSTLSINFDQACTSSPINFDQAGTSSRINFDQAGTSSPTHLRRDDESK